jgi:hypothetical protein
VIGNLPTSFWRVRRAFSRIIHKNESVAATNVNQNPSDLAVFRRSVDSAQTSNVTNFAPESS